MNYRIDTTQPIARTQANLDALPAGAVIGNQDGVYALKQDNGYWTTACPDNAQDNGYRYERHVSTRRLPCTPMFIATAK